MSKAPCSICGRRDLTNPCRECEPLTDLQRIAVKNVIGAANDLVIARKRLATFSREATSAGVATLAYRAIRSIGEEDAI